MKRYLVWAVVVLLVVGFAVVMIPSSPLSLQNTIGDPVSEDLPAEMSLQEYTNPNRVKKERPLRAWTADLASPDVAVRTSALNAVDRIAPLSGKAAIPVARLVQSDPNIDIRRKASHVLYRIGAGSKSALDIAIPALSDDDPEVRRNTVLLMMLLKADARPAVPALIQVMSDPRNDITLGHNETIQVVAAAALGGVSAGTAEAVPALTEVVTGPRPLPLRITAARSLGRVGEPAKPAVAALTALLASLSQSNLDDREDVSVALRSLGETPPDVVRPKVSYGPGYGGGNTPGPSGGDGPGGSPKKDDPPAAKKGVAPKTAKTPPTNKGG